MMTSPNTIANYDAEFAYYHARDVIKGRWPEVEPIIRQGAVCYDAYTKFCSVALKDGILYSKGIISYGCMGTKITAC